MDVIVDLPAVRPVRLATVLTPEAIAESVRDLRSYLRGAAHEPLAHGARLRMRLPVEAIALLADAVRALADTWPFLSFKLLADPPACSLEVTGGGAAGELARAVFAELGA